MPVWQLAADHAIPRPGDWDVVCDCRTPLEFIEDHIPGAINTPVLTNEQRVIVGTLYKSNPFEAQKLGASMIAANIGQIIPTHLHHLPASARILVYCWRGGHRSGSLAHVLAQIEWHAAVVEGGYKAYRKLVLRELEGLGTREFHVISGLTGTGKGAVLEALRRRGANVVDLEGLARHR
eukprot:EG_transcript_23487